MWGLSAVRYARYTYMLVDRVLQLPGLRPKPPPVQRQPRFLSLVRRGICAVPGLGFATASHDMTCRVWDSTGGLLAELVGHSAIVYCVAAVDVEGGGGAGGVVLASGSEDNTVRLWRPSGKCMQVRRHRRGAK